MLLRQRPPGGSPLLHRLGTHSRAWVVTGTLPVLVLAAFGTTAAQEEGSTETPQVRVSGFVSATMFGQDRLFGFGNGQNAQYISNAQDGPDGWWHGGDIRNTRLTVEVALPERVDGWRSGGLVEFDLFGGFPGTGGFAVQQPLPRLRLAYVELDDERTAVRIGQDWTPLAGYTPESVSHLAFPPGWGSTGVIGWRFPGIFLRHRIPAGATALTFHGAAFRGSWDNGDDAELPSAGQAGLLPQLQARIDLSAAGDIPPWELHLAGHWDSKDDDFAAVAETAPVADGRALAAGVRLRPGRFTLQGGGYWGRAIGHHAAHVSQFGDIRGWGGWAQAGMDLTERWSAWIFGGLDDPRSQDIDADEIVNNRVALLMLRYEVAGLVLGLEWQHARTVWRQEAGQGGFFDLPRSGNQVALGAALFY